MKSFLLITIFLSSTLFAENPPPAQPRRIIIPSAQPGPISQGQMESLPGNYLVTLTVSDKNGPPFELSINTASTRFSASVGEQGLTLTGTLNIDDAGNALFAYTLNWQTTAPTGDGAIQYLSSNAQSSVRLKVGEEMDILQSTSRSLRLSIRKIEPAKGN